MLRHRRRHSRRRPDSLRFSGPSLCRFRFGWQPLEERLMLDIGGANSLPPTIVVGRSLSAYDVPDVTNNTETITLTVYNQAADPITGVLLTDTLAAGVTFNSASNTASQLPDQSGQNLAWSLGTIQPFDRASVTLTVSLASTMPLMLDTGAAAYGTLDAGMVTWTTAPATLRSTAIAANLLASTPDANTTDPYVQEKAAELNYEPQQIFNFLQTDIGFNSYVGSLRGARGTLWSSAGNSLDDASLGVALMRASGIPAQYEEGTLSTAQAQQLILSMFPASYQTVGYIPSGTQLSDPADDPQLLSETKDHFWFQFDAGSGMTNADPEFAGSQIGQAATPSTNTFTEVADILRQKTEVKLTAEIYSQGAAALGIGDGLGDTVVLDQTFNDVDLVGHPLTIGNFVHSSGGGALAFTSTTNTYSPYIQIGDEANPDSSKDQVIRGTDYQEMLTNLPFGSQVLTGLFLDVTLSGPNAPAQTFEHTIIDRIGYAARQGLVATSVAVDPNGAPALTQFDVFTLNVLPGLHDPTPPYPLMAKVSQDIQSLAAAVNDGGTTVPPDADSLLRNLVTETTWLQSASLFQVSNAATRRLASVSNVVSYFDQPRLVVVSGSVLVDASEDATVEYGIDLLRNAARVIADPGQSASVAIAFNVARGVADTMSERDSVAHAAPPNQTVINTANVFEAAQAQGIQLIVLTPDDLSSLDTLLDASADARARISDALQSGKIVIVPQHPVLLGTTSTTGWYEEDPSTGDTIGVTEDGGHSALGEAIGDFILSARIAFGALGPGTQIIYFHLLGILSGAVTADLLYVNNLADWKGVVSAVVGGSGLVGIVAAIAAKLGKAAASGFPSVLATSYVAGFLEGLYIALKTVGVDPPNDGVSYDVQRVISTANAAIASEQIPANLAGGRVTGGVQVPSIQLSNDLNATWSSSTASSFQAQSFEASSAVVKDSNGNILGTGVVAIAGAGSVAMEVSGNVDYGVNGQGSLSFYAQGAPNLGVSGDWQAYSATISGNIIVRLITGALTLNGSSLPAGNYTITTSAATFSGSGTTSSPNFAGSASITATDGAVEMGPGSGSLSVGGVVVDTAHETTLTGYSGTINVSTNGNGTDAVTLSGNAGNMLTIPPSPTTLTTDQNTAVSFNANVQTSFTDTYNLTVNAPRGWTVTIGNTQKVTVTPAPGTQGGTYPIQVIVRSTTNPDLVSQSTVEVTVTPTAPGMTLSVAPDSQLTVPFNGAQLPTAFRASMRNTGPTADAYNLTFSNAPTGFTLLNSGTTVTVPAGQTGILGVYLQPTGSQLPPPGTQISFNVTATSKTDASITKTVTVTLTIPEIDAVTASANPTGLSTTPGNTATTTLTLANAGNASQNIAIQVTTPAGLAANDLGPTSLAIGQSTTEPLQLTPDAGTPLNTTLTATVSYASQPAQDVVSVLQVTARAVGAAALLPGGTPAPQGFIEVGQPVDVSATIFEGVASPRQALVSFTVMDATGKVVSGPTSAHIQLTAVADTSTVDLGQLNTTPLTAGTYTINVSVTETNGTPIAGASGGQGTLVVHSPVTASLSLDNNVQTPGNATVTDTLTIASNTQLGNLATDGAAESVAVLGSLAYVAGTQDISIVDLTNPASPQLVKTFGGSDLAQGGYNRVQVSGNNLLVASQDTSGATADFNLLVYSLANPRSPTLVSTTPVDDQFVQSLFVHGSTALATTGGINYDENGNITDQFGNLVSLDVSNPAAPAVAGSLANAVGPPDGGANNQHGVVAVNGSLAYVLGSTSTGNVTATGSGVVQVVDYSNPANLSVVNTLSIPGTIHALAIAIQGNQALVVGSSGGWTNPFADPTAIGLSGNVTLTLLSISNPANPTILSNTQVPAAQFTAGSSTGAVSAIALGNGLFAVGDVQEIGLPVLLTVDATDSTHLAVSTVDVSNNVNGMAVFGDELLTASATGMAVYRLGALFNQAVTAEVTMPTTGGVTIDPTSFSLAPTQIINGASTETLEWNLNLAALGTQTITWQTDLNGLTADEVLPVATGATVTIGGTAFSLPAVEMAAEPTIQTLEIPVEVVAPGADAIANASFAATQLGNTALADRLGDLATALDNLVENATDAVARSQVQASLTAVTGLLSADTFVSSFAPTLTTDGATVVQATTAKDVQAALTTLGTDLSALAQTLLDEAAYGFTVSLVPNTATILPGAPADFELDLRNVGNQTATYVLNYGSAAGGQGVFKQNGQTITSVTLQPGEELFGGTDGATLEVTEPDPLTPVDFVVIVVSAQGLTSIGQTVHGTLTVPASFVNVPSVEASPAFVPAGSLSTTVDVTAKVLNSVNETQSALASYTVTDGGGNVVFTSTPVPLTLTISTSLATVDLRSFDTSMLAQGSYTINVTITDTSGNPIPGAIGQGSVLVGTPVTASLSVSPTTLPPGVSTVTNTLAVQGQITLPDPLTLDGQVQTTPTGTSVALFINGAQDLAYVAGTNGIDIVDVTNPAKPVDEGAFGASDIVQGGLTVARVDNIGGTNYLIVGSTILNSTGDVAPFTLLVYSLAAPLAPTLVSTTQFANSLSGTPFNSGFLNDMAVVGNTVLIPTTAFHFTGIVFDGQVGNVLAIDVSKPAAPVLEGVLFPDTSNADSLTNQFGATIVNSQIAYIASTTTNGGDTQNGVGRVLVVDYSDPTNMKVLGEVDIPNTYQAVDVAIEGNQALVVGRTGGDGGPGVNGSMTLSVLDISSPASPTLVGTMLVTNAVFPASGVNKISALPIGNHQFAVSEGLVNGNDVLLLADVSDPNNIVVTSDNVPALANEMAVSGNLLYTTSSSGLLIYQINPIASIPFTASVEVPINASLSVVPGSFNIPPTSTLAGANFTTYSWKQSLAFGEAAPTFTWQTQVTDLQPGQSLQVAGPGTVNFTDQGTSATLDLPPQFVSTKEEMSLSPADQTVQPGAPASYTITLENPFPSDSTFGLSVVGLPANWVSLPSSATVPANGSLTVTLTLTSDEFTPDGNYDFTVLAYDGSGGDPSTAQATLTLVGTPANPPDPDSHGVVVALTPSTASAGQDTAAVYTVQVTNTGSADETFALTDSLPTGVTGTFAQTTIDVPPGVSNFRDVTITLTPGEGAAAESDPFSVTATSQTNSTATSTADGTLDVLATGVQVALTPVSGAPGGTFQLKVTNTGSAGDTFNLALASPAGLVAKLGAQLVTLAAGASQMVPVTTGAVNFADAGALPLTGIATSATNSSVQSQATADLTIAPTQSMTAAFNPAQQTLAQPGATSFLLDVNNTGNTQDSYSATISSTTGPVTASLVGLDGLPTQTLPIFILPGLSTGAILLDVSGSAMGTGTVTVTVTSLTTGSIQATATATLTINATVATLTLANNGGLALGEGTSATISQTTLQATDSDSTILPSAIVYTLTAAPKQGTLTLAGQALAQGNTFTQDDINNGRLRYHAGAEGADSFAFSVAAGGLSGPSAMFVIAVSDPAVAATGGFTYTAAEGSTAASQAVATFTDPGGAEPLAKYSASIAWGDGTSAAAGTISGPDGNGVFTVSGQHAYSEEGSYTIDVTLSHAGAPAVTVTSTALASDPAVAATGGFTYTAAEGSTAASQAVATFTDPGGTEALASYSASIAWGDGTSAAAGTISGPDGNGVFTVSGQHAYSEEGTYTATVAVTHAGAPDATATSTAVVSDPAVAENGGFTVTAAAGSASASQTLATFTDPGGAEALADYSATIAWGDGTSSPGAINEFGGTFTVSGSHSYASAGTESVAVTVAHENAATATATSTAIASGTSTQSLSGVGVAVNGFEFSPLSGVAVATFTLSGASVPAGPGPSMQFSATIDWGDGATSAGSVALAGGTYTVSGSHTYADERVYPVSVAISGDGLSATVTTQATILEELLPDGTRGTANQRFVMEIYRDVLDRAAEQGGLDYWTAKLDAGESHSQLAHEIVQLALPREEQRDEVQALYETYLHRAPDAGGLEHWTAFLYDGGTDEELAAILVSAPEYRQSRGGGTNDGFLDALFQDALGRTVDASGRVFYDAIMAKGATPASVAAIIFGSDEYRRDLVSGLYERLLDRPADPRGLDAFVGQLAAGQRDEQIIAEMVASDEYFAKTAD